MANVVLAQQQTIPSYSPEKRQTKIKCNKIQWSEILFACCGGDGGLKKVAVWGKQETSRKGGRDSALRQKVQTGGM